MSYQRDYWESGKLAYRDPMHPVVHAFVQPKLDYVRKHVNMGPETLVLDVGAGNGTFTCYLKSYCRAWGTDLSALMISLSPCKELLVRGDALDLPFRSGGLDIVFCSNVLHHLDDPLPAVREMERVSRSYVIIHEPNRDNPLMSLYALAVKADRNSLRYSRGFLRGLVQEAGMKVVSCVSMGMVFQQKTPRFLLPLLGIFDRPVPFGAYNLVVAKKI